MKKINESILNKKYFIFDVDGTLVDSMSMWNSVDQKILHDNFGIEISLMDIKMFRDSVIYDAKNVQGDIYMAYYEAIVKYFNLGVSAEEFNRLRAELSNYLSVNELDYKPGAAEFLKLAKKLGKKIGVATTGVKRQYDIYENKNQKMIKQASLKKLVDATVHCEDVTNKKPDPEAYFKIMEKLGAKPEECIVFEDSLNGVMAAKGAGLEVCSIYDDSAANEQDVIDKIADYKVESFYELIKSLGLESFENQPEN